jgi:hypothetical protein
MTMKRIKTVGLLLLAILAVGAFAASTASAEEGLLGFTGGASGEGGGGTLQFTGGNTFICAKLSILNVKLLPASFIHGEANLHFTGCKLNGVLPINSLTDLKEVILVKVLFFICFTNKAALETGLYLSILNEKEEEGNLHLEVPSVSGLLFFKGALIATNLSGLKGDKNEGKTFKFELKGSKGKQEGATSCEIAGKKLSYTLKSEENENGKPENASEATSFTINFGEKVEFMDT